SPNSSGADNTVSDCSGWGGTTGTSPESRMRGSSASNSGLRRAGRSGRRTNGARNAAPMALTMARLLKRCTEFHEVEFGERARRLLQLEAVEQVVVAGLRVVALGERQVALRVEHRQQREEARFVSLFLGLERAFLRNDRLPER